MVHPTSRGYGGYSIDLHHVARVRSFDAARHLYETAAPWRESTVRAHSLSYLERPLANTVSQRAKYHMSITRTVDGSYAFRLWDTPLVTWHPDQSVTIQSYPSRSSSVFVGHFAPSGVSAQFTCPVGPLLALNSERPLTTWEIWWNECRFYQMHETNKLHLIERDGVWQPDPALPPRQWCVPHFDRAKAAQALAKYNYQEFRVWSIAYGHLNRELGGVADVSSSYYDDYSSRIVPLSALRDPTRAAWPLLAGGHWSHAKLRQLIYQQESCIDVEVTPVLVGLRSVNRALAAMHKYSHAL